MTTTRILSVAAAAGAAILGVVLYFHHPQLLEALCQEDGLVESTTALMYVAACWLLVRANRRWQGRNVWLWGLALMMMLVAGEEISWGQRALGLETPAALAKVNVQHEANLHNIRGIHGQVRAAAVLFLTGFCFLLPAAAWCSPGLGSRLQRIALPVFPLWVAPIMAVAILLMAVPRVMFGSIIFELDELGEWILAFGFLLFAIEENQPC